MDVQREDGQRAVVSAVRVCRVLAVCFGVVAAVLTALLADSLFGEVSRRGVGRGTGVPCGGEPMGVGEVVVSVGIVVVVLTLLFGLAALLWSLRWRTVGVVVAVVFVVLVLLFAGGVIAADAGWLGVDYGVGDGSRCLPPRLGVVE